MITPSELLSYLKATPFRPFQIHMASGQTYDVRHPEMARVGRNVLLLFTFVSSDRDVFDRWETISLMLMESVSHLDHSIPQT
jgi:hypothetical protein